MATFHLDIITPFGSYFSQEVDSVKFSNDEYVLMMLAHHTPIVSKVGICEVVIKVNNKNYYYAVSGGLINFNKDNIATLMVNSIERNDEIDVGRAEKAKKRAIDRLNNKDDRIINKERAEKALKRSEIRLMVALKK